jgi:membrane protease YdiL (CAAX protease family)
VEASTPDAGAPRAGRLVGWLALVGAVAALNYASRLAGGDDGDDGEALYEYSTAVGGLVFYGVLLAVLLVLARGSDLRRVFALRRPASWGSALLALLGALVAIWVANAVLTLVLDLQAGEEQGVVPDRWEPDRAGAYVANFVVIAFFGPVVEELTYRGFGQTAVAAVAGPVAGVVVTGVLFGLAHGLVEGLAALTIFGLVAGWLRVRTDSLYPPIVLHVLFNGLALILAVTVDTEL